MLRLNTRATVIAAALLSGTIACGGAGAPAPASGPPAIAFQKYTLPNGLDVILSEDHRLPTVSVDLWYHVGPANEAAGRTGFAHLFEHMMFQGSKHVPGNSHFQLLEAAGGTNLNGTTDFDRTNYFETLPANRLELGLWLESDRMGYLLDALDEQQLAGQRGVVRGERKQSVENEPYGIVGEALYHTVFPKGHPYYADVIGSHDDIQAAKLEDVRTFFKTYYAPNNASLAIVGDIDATGTRALVEKYFGPLKRGPEVPKVQIPTPAITAERRVVVKDHVPLQRVYLGWITPAFFKDGDADADVTANALGGGKSSRLYKKLVYEKQIAQDVSAFQQSLTLGSVFQITATARPGHTAGELEAAIDTELDALRQSGPDAAELERARNTLETQRLTGLETEGGFGGVADMLNLYNHYLGDPGYLQKDLARYQSVTTETAKKFANTYLQTSARAVVYGVPGEPDLGPAPPMPDMAKVQKGPGGEAYNTDEPWRKDAPAPGPERPLALPTPVSFTLANGLTVILNERTGMPVVAANLVVKTGGDANPIDRPGLANYTAAMLDQGTASKSAPQIADAVARLGASLDATSSKDATFVSGQSLTKHFAATLDLMAEIVLHPSFPQAEVERQRASRMGDLAQIRSDPGSIATATAIAALYGMLHPYGYMEMGTEASARSTSRDDIVTFWTKNFVPNNAALIVAGPIGQAELKALVEKAFGGWAKGTPAGPTAGTMTSTPARVVIVDVGKSQQTQLRVATIGVPRSTPDYASLNVMNNILGGLFSSRINLNLREDHSWTYGANSQFTFRKGAGPFWVGSGVDTPETGPAVGEILKEIRKMADTAVTPGELAMGKDALTRSLPAAFETSSSAVNTLNSLFIYDLGLDYYARFPASVTAITADAVQAAAKKYLVPEKMIVIAVGQQSSIEPGLRKLNLGAIEFRNKDTTVKR
jgi:zinc protease